MRFTAFAPETKGMRISLTRERLFNWTDVNFAVSIVISSSQVYFVADIMSALFAEPNVAILRPTLVSASFDRSGPYAADGCASPYLLHHSCTRVQPVGGRSWWAVDLEKPHHVSGVTILSSKDYEGET